MSKFLGAIVVGWALLSGPSVDRAVAATVGAPASIGVTGRGAAVVEIRTCQCGRPHGHAGRCQSHYGHPHYQHHRHHQHHGHHHHHHHHHGAHRR